MGTAPLGNPAASSELRLSVELGGNREVDVLVHGQWARRHRAV